MRIETLPADHEERVIALTNSCALHTHILDRRSLILLRQTTRAPLRRIRLDAVIAQFLRKSLPPSLQIRLGRIEPAPIAATRKHYAMHMRRRFISAYSKHVIPLLAELFAR